MFYIYAIAYYITAENSTLKLMEVNKPNWLQGYKVTI